MFRNLKLGPQIGIGFGVVILLLIIVSTFAMNGLEKSKEGFEEYRQLAKGTNLVGRIQENILKARLSGRNFIQSHNRQFKTEFHEEFSLIKSSLEEADHVIHNPERMKKIQIIEEHVNEYEESFDTVTRLMVRRDDLLHTILIPMGSNMRKRMEEIMISSYNTNDADAVYYAGRIQEHALMARLHFMKFLENNTKSEVERVRQEIGPEIDALYAEIDATLQDPERRQMLADFQQARNTYREAFEELQAVIFERNENIAIMNEIGPLIYQASEDVELSLKKDQKTLGPQVQISNQRTNKTVIIVSLIALIAGIAFAWIITVGIVSPLGKSLAFVERIAKGDLTAEITINQKDEVGQMISSLQLMSRKLKDIVTDIQSAGYNVSSGSQQLSSSAQQLSQGASDQAVSVEEASASMEQMGSNIKQTASNSTETERIAMKASQDALESGIAVKEAIQAMADISEKISVVEEIASQTNLLALNAAIEAARAGDQGKGFAVVAAEVRKLAERSQDAAKEISELSSKSMGVAKKAGEMLDHLVPDIQKTAHLVQEISASSKEQDTGTEQINKAILQLDGVIQQNASFSEEMAATSEELASQSMQLQRTIGFFHTGTESLQEKPIDRESGKNLITVDIVKEQADNRLFTALEKNSSQKREDQEFTEF